MTATQTQPKTLTENNLAETTHRYLRRERYRAAGGDNGRQFDSLRELPCLIRSSAVCRPSAAFS